MNELTGRVVSNAMKNTIVVEVMRQKVHPLYKKIIRSSIRLKANCETTDIKVGDMVKIKSCRPISKDKHYQFVGIITKDNK